MFGVVFGLSIDYAVFLLMRMKESYDVDHNNAKAISLGLEKAARVITGAAAIMMAVFIAFAAAPEYATVSQLGIGLTVAVLLDATVVRIVLLPALMLLLGDRVWHVPKWLDRILPELDIEGEEQRATPTSSLGGKVAEEPGGGMSRCQWGCRRAATRSGRTSRAKNSGSCPGVTIESGNSRAKSFASCSERRFQWASNGRGAGGASPRSWASKCRQGRRRSRSRAHRAGQSDRHVAGGSGRG